MSIFDSIKNALGGKSDIEDVTMAPSQLLANAGIDTQGLDLEFGNRSITVSGDIPDEATRDRILHILSGITGIDTIEDALTLAPEAAPEPESDSESGPAAADDGIGAAEASEPDEGNAAAAASSGEQVTVEPGDTLWRIAERAYGDGARYTEIFEANRDVLEDPDHIEPGQVLRIP